MVPGLQGSESHTHLIGVHVCSVASVVDSMDCCPPGSCVHGILQARILECVAISSSRGSSQPRDLFCISCIGWWILNHWATWEAPSHRPQNKNRNNGNIVTSYWVPPMCQFRTFYESNSFNFTITLWGGCFDYFLADEEAEAESS